MQVTHQTNLTKEGTYLCTNLTQETHTLTHLQFSHIVKTIKWTLKKKGSKSNHYNLIELYH